MEIGIRLRCHPEKKLINTLWQWIGAQEFVYNAKTYEDRYFRSFKRFSVNHAGEYAPVDQAYSQFKGEDTEWMRSIPSQILRNSAAKWMQAYQRFFKKLGGRPTIQSKHGRRSVWITDELFRLIPGYRKGLVVFELGTKANPVGRLEVRVHQAFKVPKTITISMQSGHWHLSMTNDDPSIVEADDSDTAAYLRQFTEEELLIKTVGIDRGVVTPFVDSAGNDYALSPVQQKRIAKKLKSQQRWQRRMARRVAGSKRYRRAKGRAASARRYVNNVHRDFSHQTSQAMTSNPEVALLVVEDLKIGNMTASASGTVEAPGQNVAQKSGLNKAILSSGWGRTITYATYKARRLGKLVYKVSPYCSSQECSLCGHTHSDNRPTQERFVCQQCGHTDNADRNAALVLRQRGVRQLLAQEFTANVVKRCGVTRKKVGAGCSEPAAKPTLVETTVSHRADASVDAVLASVKRETPPTS